MKKNIKDIAIDAKTLGGLTSPEFARRQSFTLVSNKVLRLNLSSNVDALIAINPNAAYGRGMLFISGYGTGTNLRNSVCALNQSYSGYLTSISVYNNGASEEKGGIYIKNNSGASIIIHVLALNNSIVSTIIDSVPEDATLINLPYIQQLTTNQILQDMQLTDLQSQMGGGVEKIPIPDCPYFVTIRQKGGQRNEKEYKGLPAHRKAYGSGTDYEGLGSRVSRHKRMLHSRSLGNQLGKKYAARVVGKLIGSLSICIFFIPEIDKAWNGNCHQTFKRLSQFRNKRLDGVAFSDFIASRKEVVAVGRKISANNLPTTFL